MHEAVHFFLDLIVWFEPDIKVQDDFVEACSLNLFQGIGDTRRLGTFPQDNCVVVDDGAEIGGVAISLYEGKP